MVDLTPFLPGLSPVQGKAVVARFDGGRLSAEGGLLALREIERRLGLADRLANCLVDPRGHRQLGSCRLTESAMGWARPGDTRDCAAMATPVTSVAKAWVRPDRRLAAVSWSR